MGNSIKPHIENAQKTGVCSLKGMKLKELPPEISSLPKTLRTLDLSDNQLQLLTSLLGQFVMLKSLNVNNNKLKSIPNEISKLLKLETLSLSFNLLQTFQLNSSSKMKHLKTIHLNDNKLKVFPVQLCELPDVDAIDLSSNLITKLPDELHQLKAIELNMNRNRLKNLNDSLSKCERLKVLRIEENCLTLDSLTPVILKESQISVLAFDGNTFDMKQFQDVDGYTEYIGRYSASKKKFI